jgi:hypothetical protein
MQPTVAFDVAENGQVARRNVGVPIRVRLVGLVAGDVIEDELADVTVVADDDEDRRRSAVGSALGIGFPFGKAFRRES